MAYTGVGRYFASVHFLSARQSHILYHDRQAVRALIEDTTGLFMNPLDVHTMTRSYNQSDGIQSRKRLILCCDQYLYTEHPQRAEMYTVSQRIETEVRLSRCYSRLMAKIAIQARDLLERTACVVLQTNNYFDAALAPFGSLCLALIVLRQACDQRLRVTDSKSYC